MTRMPRLIALVAGGVLALTLVGCSQIAAIAPVGGTHLAEVRFAANDLLVEAEIDVMTAPDCSSEDDGTITCQGETLDGEAITVESTADDPDSLTVTVGADVLYSGSILDVLNKALRPA